MSAIKLTPQQAQAVESRGGAILVSAAAGSGKTKVLVERLLKQVTDEGKDIDSFLIITYTNAAASELRSKIADALYERIASDPGNVRLHKQIERCYRAKISTIHSFCSDIIRENAHILGISPDFRVIDEQEADILKDKVLSDLLDEKYENIADDPAFSELTDSVSAGRTDKKLEMLILEAYEKMQMSIDPEAWAQEQKTKLCAENVTDVSETVWGKEIISHTGKTVSYWIDRMGAVLDTAEADEQLYKKYGASLEAAFDGLLALDSAIRGGKWDDIRTASAVPFPRPGGIAGYEDIKSTRRSCMDEMKLIASKFACTSDELLSDMRSAFPMISELIDTATEFSHRYSDEKLRRGVIDFSDQEHLALKVLLSADGERTQAALDVSARFTEIMVDEYQDVNAVQEAIFSAVSKNGKNVFMVGDVKQSIYRFRLADPGIFIEKYRSMRPADEAEDGEDRKIILSSNFRSRAGILAAVNHVFSNVMSEEVGEIDYTEDERLNPGLDYPENGESETELILVNTGDSYGDGERPDKLSVEADAVAEKIHALKNSVRLSDGAGGLREARWSDFAILLRSVSGKAEVFASSMIKRGIPVNADRSGDFFKSAEILTMISMLAVIDNPRQDVPLISVMRSFLFGFTADELAKIRQYDRNADFYDALVLSSEDSEKVRDFLGTLESFRTSAPDVTADRLLWEIYMRTGALAIVGAMSGGNVRQENLMALFDLAQKYERDGGSGLFGFVSYLRESAENGSVTVSGGENADGVTIMSIHKSKGLEFPIVILADTAKRFNLGDAYVALPIHSKLGFGPEITDLRRKIHYPSIAKTAISARMIRETVSEELRVLYVAMTRAREKLVIFASYDDAEKKLSKISAQIADGISSKAAGGVSSYADWILMAALIRRECAEALSCDCGYTSPDDGYIWHAEIVTPTDAETDNQPETEETPSDDTEYDTTELERKLSFVYPHKPSERIPSKLTATEMKGRFIDSEASEEAHSAVKTDDFVLLRPDFDKKDKPLTGAERGTALHLVMQLASYPECKTPDGTVREIARLRESRLITPEQADAVDPKKVYGFFATDTGKRLLAAENMRREFKFSVLIPAERIYPGADGDEILLQGVIDCFFEDGDGLHIIDYKTDRVTDETITERAEYYRGQLETYTMALEAITGKKVVSRGLYFFACDRLISL